MKLLKRIVSEIKYQYKKRVINNRFFLKIDPHYIDWVNDLRQNHSYFVPFTQTKYDRQANDVKVFAYYLPQFYPIKENNQAFGDGFTEWTNVAQGMPQFIGHYQPKIPYDLGFYSLNNYSTIYRQVEIAKAYGIYGFCYYYYWFSGKTVLDEPLKLFLSSNIDFHYHFCWANENWTKRWDGGNHEMILEQKLDESDYDRFFYDILPYIKDDRYEKIDNRPMLIIYQPGLFSKNNFTNFCNRINHLAIKEGFNGFYITMTPFNICGNYPKDYNIDGLTEFRPHDMDCEHIVKKTINPKANICIHNVHKFLNEGLHLRTYNCQTFKSCFPDWDNSSRKLYLGCDIFEMDSSDFEKWLYDIIIWTKQNNDTNKQYVYINAWNEWAESAILEPTTRYGFQNLEIVKKCIEKSRFYHPNN